MPSYLMAFGFLGLLFSQSLGAQSNPSGNEPKIINIDGVVAIVNTGVVTRKEIDDRIASIQKQAPAGGKKLPEGDELRKQVLENLILEKIQIQEAEQTGLAVNEKELNKIIEDIATRNKLTFSEFRDAVTKSGVSFQRYRELLREDVLKARLREREVDSQIKISDAEIDNFIIEQMQRRGSEPTATGSGPEEIAVAQIFVPVEEGAGPSAQADARKRAEALLKEARGDTDFMQLGVQANKENSRIKFQDLGYRTQDRLPQIFVEAVRNLGPGQVAPSVVRSPAGFHVLKVMDRRAGGSGARAATSNTNPADLTPQNMIVTQTLARHILIRQRQGLQDADVERRLQGYRDQIRAKTADFEALAKKFSEDGSAPNGGLLGWMGPGELVPPFEIAMNRLQIGEVSDPVKTEFGWHLIQVLERRDAQLTVEKQREFARAAIRERKFEQAYQDWLRQLRDTATVKILNLDEQVR
ncbi:peptidylprolyl isomerase [Polynucleobacter sp. HIN8]|uniref:peptidylprolyl isomerase n=1 Tax=Polynucleobacter sp. HIN8 TaxID=3047867 RepID=UPI002573D3B1|nr:peptidylprolyl isomerase [Polynucleobacter sp. HIN8]